MTADQLNYIEIHHIQGTGNEHVSIAVEIETSSTGHQNSNREIQQLQINPYNVRELTTIVVEDPDGGEI